MMGVVYDAFPESPAEVPPYNPEHLYRVSFLWEACSRVRPAEEVNSLVDLPPDVHAAIASGHLRADRRGHISITSWSREWVPAADLSLPPELNVDGMWRYTVATRAAWR